ISPTQPFVVRPYGDPAAARPVVTMQLFRMTGGGGVPNDLETNNIAFSSIEVHMRSLDPDADEFTGTGDSGVLLLRAFRSLVMEDMAFRFAQVNIQAPSPGASRGLIVRRLIMVDNYSTSGHAQGVFLHNVYDA